jgi:hypothetical protein
VTEDRDKRDADNWRNWRTTFRAVSHRVTRLWEFHNGREGRESMPVRMDRIERAIDETDRDANQASAWRESIEHRIDEMERRDQFLRGGKAMLLIIAAALSGFVSLAATLYNAWND